jgi:hypothetical protein
MFVYIVQSCNHYILLRRTQLYTEILTYVYASAHVTRYIVQYVLCCMDITIR